MFPRHVARYELLLPIGTGATATVYLARTKVVGDVYRQVAVKLVHPHLREEMSDDLLDEARVAAGIRHPHVVSVIEADLSPHGAFLALEYVEGETLAYLAKNAPKRRLPLPLLARIVSDMLDGLHAAHEHRDPRGQPTLLVHRDLSLRNVLVGTDGVSRLADFGIAKLADRGARTKTGHAKGTVPYMSPEQALGQALDRRSDVWAAGVVVWELLTGQRLFQNDNEASVLMEIVSGGPIVMPSAVRRELPAEIDEALRFALTRDRERRCPDALELKRRLLGVLEHEVANHREVGALVTRVAGENLEARRRAVADVVAERRVVVDVAPAEAPSTTESVVTAKRPVHSARRAWLALLPLAALIVAVALVWPRAGIELMSLELPSVTLPRPAVTSAILNVSANAPIAEIQIGDRLPLIVEPKRELAITLSPRERGEKLLIVVRSVDGREARAEATPQSTAIELNFTSAPATKTRIAPSRRPGRGASPYEK